MATDLHGGLVQRQPPPRRFHIYRFRLGFSPHTPAPEPTTELCIPAPVHRSHPLSFIGPETGKSQLSRPAAYAQRTGKTTFAGLRSVRLRGKMSRLWCRQQDLNLRTRKFFISELYPPSFCLHIAPSGRSRSPAHQEKKREKKKDGDAEFAPASPRYHIFFCCCISLCNIT